MQPCEYQGSACISVEEKSFSFSAETEVGPWSETAACISVKNIWSVSFTLTGVRKLLSGPEQAFLSKTSHQSLLETHQAEPLCEEYQQ